MSERASSIPTLESARLVLRGMTRDDAAVVQRLAGDKRIAATTMLIPHPYPDGAAEQWISMHQPEFERGEGAVWAVTLRESGELVGAIGLRIEPEHNRAELGYWIGVPYWNNGYITEAAELVLGYGFEQRKLNRIHAYHFASNPPSGRVMQKLGMKHEGTLRQHIVKWDRVEDAVYYAMLREEFQSSKHENPRP